MTSSNGRTILVSNIGRCWNLGSQTVICNMKYVDQETKKKGTSLISFSKNEDEEEIDTPFEMLKIHCDPERNICQPVNASEKKNALFLSVEK